MDKTIEFSIKTTAALYQQEILDQVHEYWSRSDNEYENTKSGFALTIKYIIDSNLNRFLLSEITNLEEIVQEIITEYTKQYGDPIAERQARNLESRTIFLDIKAYYGINLKEILQLVHDEWAVPKSRYKPTKAGFEVAVEDAINVNIIDYYDLEDVQNLDEIIETITKEYTEFYGDPMTERTK